MTMRRTAKHVANAGRRKYTHGKLSTYPDASPPSLGLIEYVVQRLVTDRKAVRDPAHRRLEAALRVGTVVEAFRDPFAAPDHLFTAAVRDLATRGRSGWVAACAAVASLEPQALAEAAAAHTASPDLTVAPPDASATADLSPETDQLPDAGEGPDTDTLPNADLDHVREACRVVVTVVPADELRAMIAKASAPTPTRAPVAVARRTRRVASRQPEPQSGTLDDAPVATINAPCALSPDASVEIVEAVEIVADATITQTVEAVPGAEAVADAYLEDGLALLLAARKDLRAYGITLPSSFDTARCDAASRAQAVCAITTLLRALDAAVSDPSTRHRVARAYEALAKLVPAGRDPEAPAKRTRRSVPPPYDLAAFLTARAARVAAMAPPILHTDATAETQEVAPEGGAPVPTNVRHLPAPVAPELQVVRRLFRAGDFHGAEVALEVVEVADRASWIALTQAMQARLNLDFDRAGKLAAQASQNAADPTGPLAEAARALEAECATGVPTGGDDQWDAWQSSQDASAVRIADIYWQADLLARRDAHVEVVARLTAVIDTALRWMVGREFGLDLLKADREATALWEALESRPEVFEVATETLAATFPRVSEETFRYVDGLVAVVRGLASESAAHDAACAGRLRSIVTRIDNLRVVREMRHRSFLGHRPNRVSTAEMAWAAKRALSASNVSAGTRPAEMLLGSVSQVLRDMGVPLATANPLLRWGARLGCLVAPGTAAHPSCVGA